jgi:hypothetical protein
MARIFLTALFSLLLVGMQQQLLVHEVDHLRAKIQRGPDSALQSSTAGECTECALLASGSNAAPAVDSTAMPVIGASTRVALSFESSLAVAPPAFYNSRAPPAIL